ncbi:MAG TPA: hypothetical protein VFF06_31735 [Polyangia bacterium]|nr:hypothetical protein [Polyangia bacterium]
MENVDTRPAVQAILTADTLIQHYVRAVDKVRRSLGRDELEMSAQIGDANRTYPSIWEHLDHARALLAAEGRGTSEFDRLREAAGGNTVQGIDSERSPGKDLFGGYQQQTLTLHFNLRGVNLAHHASHALKQVMTEVDWKRLELQDSIPVADLKRGKLTWWIIGLAAAGAAAYLLLR